MDYIGLLGAERNRVWLKCNRARHQLLVGCWQGGAVSCTHDPVAAWELSIENGQFTCQDETKPSLLFGAVQHGHMVSPLSINEGPGWLRSISIGTKPWRHVLSPVASPYLSEWWLLVAAVSQFMSISTALSPGPDIWWDGLKCSAREIGWANKTGRDQHHWRW